MTVLHRLVASCAVLVIALGATIGSGKAAPITKPALLPLLIGTWSCTYTGPKGKQTSSVTFTQLDDAWIQGIGKNGAYGNDPANSSVDLIGYDAKKQRYVDMSGNTQSHDSYGISHAVASVNALTMTWVGDFPADPSNGKTLYHFTSTKITSHTTWTEKGKAMSGDGVCTKS